jgi:uncharacterized RDD family membrane protein YckC
MSEFQNPHASPPAGLFVRLGALISDSLVVFGLLALSTLFLFVPLLSKLNKKAMMPSEVGWTWSLIYFSVMLGVCFAFYGYFWTRTGQTIGMRAWRIRAEAQQADVMTWFQAMQRWLTAIGAWIPCLLFTMFAEQRHSRQLGWLGEVLALVGAASWLTMYGDLQRRTWHDRFSKTRVVKLPKP